MTERERIVCDTCSNITFRFLLFLRPIKVAQQKVKDTNQETGHKTDGWPFLISHAGCAKQCKN